MIYWWLGVLLRTYPWMNNTGLCCYCDWKCFSSALVWINFDKEYMLHFWVNIGISQANIASEITNLNIHVLTIRLSHSISVNCRSQSIVDLSQLSISVWLLILLDYWTQSIVDLSWLLISVDCWSRLIIDISCLSISVNCRSQE